VGLSPPPNTRVIDGDTSFCYEFSKSHTLKHWLVTSRYTLKRYFQLAGLFSYSAQYHFYSESGIT
jgi:hypothetical protein